jgi:hypothetical protein
MVILFMFFGYGAAMYSLGHAKGSVRSKNQERAARVWERDNIRDFHGRP